MEDIAPKKLLRNSFFLTHCLSIKYGRCKQEYETMCIDSLIYSFPSRYFITFKEICTWNDCDEFLKRKYTKKESMIKIPKFASYYKNYQVFFGHPMFRNFTFDNIIQSYGDNKAELFYKKTYGNKHTKKGHNNSNKDRNISLEESNDSKGKDFIADNKTIFDMISRKTIENNILTSVELITNNSHINSKLLSDAFNNEDFFTKRNSLEDSLIFLVDYMNKKKLNKKNENIITRKCRENNFKKTRTRTILQSKSNCKSINMSKRDQKSAMLHSSNKNFPIAGTSPGNKPIQSFIISMYRNKKNGNALISKEYTSFSPKISHNSSNMTHTYNPSMLSPQYNKNHHIELPRKTTPKCLRKTNKYSFNSSIPVQKNANANDLNNNNNNKVLEKHSTLSKYLSNNTTKHNSKPKRTHSQQKKSSGLYKKVDNKPIKNSISKTNNNYLNYVNSCSSRNEIVFSDKHPSKEGSISVQQSNFKARQTHFTMKNYHNHKSGTRNTLNNPRVPTSESVKTHDYHQSTSPVMKKAIYSKINVNLTMNTLGVSTQIKKTKGIEYPLNNTSDRNYSRPGSKCSSKDKIFLVHHKNNSKVLSPYSNLMKRRNDPKNILINIKDLKKELKERYSPQKSIHYSKDKIIKKTKPKRCQVFAFNNTNTSHCIDTNNTHMDSNHNQVQLLKQTRNDRIVVNRSNFKSFNNTSTSTINNYNNNRDKSPWTRNGLSNSINGSLNERIANFS